MTTSLYPNLQGRPSLEVNPIVISAKDIEIRCGVCGKRYTGEKSKCPYCNRVKEAHTDPIKRYDASLTDGERASLQLKDKISGFKGMACEFITIDGKKCLHIWDKTLITCLNVWTKFFFRDREEQKLFLDNPADIVKMGEISKNIDKWADVLTAGHIRKKIHQLQFIISPSYRSETFDEEARLWKKAARVGAKFGTTGKCSVGSIVGAIISIGLGALL
jgi:hypothetical protein